MTSLLSTTRKSPVATLIPALTALGKPIGSEYRTTSQPISCAATAVLSVQPLATTITSASSMFVFSLIDSKHGLRIDSHLANAVGMMIEYFIRSLVCSYD